MYPHPLTYHLIQFTSMLEDTKEKKNKYFSSFNESQSKRGSHQVMGNAKIQKGLKINSELFSYINLVAKSVLNLNWLETLQSLFLH